MKHKYIIQDWVLYDYELVGFISTDAATGQEFADVKEQAKSFRVFGTKEQLLKLQDDYNIDEIYSYKKLEYGSYWEGICFSDNPENNKPTLKEFNQEYEKKYKKYLKYYKENKNQPIKIGLI
tara:strand:- start:4417 stop:4782 length:366 start_codon:yes stop_codon:yes gene_type:complete